MIQPSSVDRSVIDKIKKLLIKHDGCKKINSEAEAEVALNMAFKMMQKHHLSMSAVLTESASGDEEIFVIESECEKYIANELPVWLQNLVQLINLVCNTECILRKYKTTRSAKQLFINFIGERNDVSRCLELYKFFKGVSMKLSREHQKKVNGTFTQWRSFAEGFTGRLLEKASRDEEELNAKLRKLQQRENPGFQSVDDMEDLSDTDEESESNDFPQDFEYGLVLQSNELVSLNRYKTYVKEKITEFLKQQDSKKEKLKESSKIDSSSFYQGRLAANQYNLTRNSTSRLRLT
jgi:hypothetical protein